MSDEFYNLNLAHVSMYHGLNRSQAEHDAKRIFREGYDWVTGTEAGQNPVQGVLRSFAEDYKYKFHTYKSNWIAVRRDIIDRGTFKKGGKTVVDNDDYVGRGHDLNLCFVQFENDDLGEIAIAASHYATRGRPVAGGPYSVNAEDNEKLAKAIGRMAERKGDGTALFFYGGDQNIPDNKFDTFFGEPLTSIQDQLKKYPGTGHGPIDVIASYDGDKRVEPVFVRALNDSTQFMYTDHFVVEARYRVRKIRRGR